MSTSANKGPQDGYKRATLIYLGASAFCLVFFLIYDRFSHGVHSPYMTWLCGWPFVLGVLPCALFWRFGALRRAGRLCVNLWNCGVAALTVSSMLRGIFEIAGTGSEYQVWLMRAGAAALLCAVAAYIIRRAK